MIENFWQVFQFFATSLGLITIGAVAALTLLLWDWRGALLGLCIIQVGVGAVAVLVEGVPGQWMIVQSGVVVVACLILLLSAQRVGKVASFYYSGTWLLRLMSIALVYGAWQLLSGVVSLPEISGEVLALFTWLGVCALVLMAMGESPLYTGVALLLWCTPMQVIVAVLLSIPTLVMLIGILELLIALSCSYLILVESYGLVSPPVALTDIAFPEAASHVSEEMAKPTRDARTFRRPAGFWDRFGDRLAPDQNAKPASLSGESDTGAQVPVASRPKEHPLLARRRQ